MTPPTPHTVTHHRAAGSSGGPLNQRTRTFAPPQTRQVHGWRSVSSEENQSAALAGRVTSELLLFSPDGDWAAGDRVGIGDRIYEVVGDPHDVSHGPFPFGTGLRPGFRITLRRVTDG